MSRSERRHRNINPPNGVEWIAHKLRCWGVRAGSEIYMFAVLICVPCGSSPPRWLWLWPVTTWGWNTNPKTITLVCGSGFCCASPSGIGHGSPCVPNQQWVPLYTTSSTLLLCHQPGFPLNSLICRLHALQLDLSPGSFLPLPLLGCGLGLAGAMLGDRDRGCFGRHFAWRHPWVLSNVHCEVGVEWLQLSGQQLIGEGVEAIRAPVEPGPFQKIKPGIVKLASKGWRASLPILWCTSKYIL